MASVESFAFLKPRNRRSPGASGAGMADNVSPTAESPAMTQTPLPSILQLTPLNPSYRADPHVALTICARAAPYTATKPPAASF